MGRRYKVKLVGSGEFQVRPGWMIIDASSATGGITYDRKKIAEKPINRGAGIQSELTTRKIVDHVEFCAAIDGVVKKVDYVLRKHCARTSTGWFADDIALAHVKAEVKNLKIEARALNEAAERANSKREAYISVVPYRLDFNHVETTEEIARTVRSVLTAIHDALRAGELKDLHKLRIRAKNLDKLAVGSQSEAIRFVLEQVPVAAKELRDALRDAAKDAKDKGKISTLGAALDAVARRVGKRLNLEPIEAVLAHFDDAPPAVGLRVVEAG